MTVDKLAALVKVFRSHFPKVDKGTTVKLAASVIETASIAGAVERMARADRKVGDDAKRISEASEYIKKAIRKLGQTGRSGGLALIPMASEIKNKNMPRRFKTQTNGTCAVKEIIASLTPFADQLAEAGRNVAPSPPPFFKEDGPKFKGGRPLKTQALLTAKECEKAFVEMADLSNDIRENLSKRAVDSPFYFFLKDAYEALGVDASASTFCKLPSAAD
jgi:hypothetical protein